MVLTHDNFLYLQFICCLFCSGLCETLHMMKSIFDDCKELAKKTESENQRNFVKDSFKKVSSGATF